MGLPKEIADLIERFERNRESYKSGQYNEMQLRQEFLDPFFAALGWDMNNQQGYAEAYKEVIHEDSIKVGADTKAPDYCFRIGGTRKFFLEAKKPAVYIKEDISPAFQLRRYAWSAKLPLSIITDFEEFAVYDARIKPEKTDKASNASIHYFTYKDYEKQWDLISSVFSRETVLKGSFDKYAEKSRLKKGTATVDDAFLTEIEDWRDMLAKNIALRNADLTTRELNFAVQRTIDRIVFLRICEDRGIEEYGRLQMQLNGTNIYKRLVQLFNQADDRYNSGLFHFQREKERHEEPDKLTLNIAIDDKPLKDIINRLYYPESPYEFSVLSADILGQVYEQFLGKVIRLTAGHQAKVEEKPEVRKAGCVYYTPKYIVDYIVKNTVGKSVRILCLLMLLLGLLIPVSLPSLSHAEQQPKRPKIGLVLGGGGAKGSAHIGVLKVLEELKVPIDFIGGTSMGAVVGGMYASGMSPEEIERALTAVEWDDLFTDSPPRREIDFLRKREDMTILSAMELGIKDGRVRALRGFIAGQKIRLLFETLLMPVSDITDFDKLPTPYRAVAADLGTGKAVVLKGGRLADAARASMSVPGVFPPVEVNGHLLCDGGIVRNLPVDVVREMGADIIIAVDVGKPLLPKEKLASVLAISNQMIDIMIKSNVQAQIETLAERDVFMRPDLGTIESGDFQRAKEAIARGMKAAREKEAVLRRLSVSDGEYEVYRTRHQGKTPVSVKVGEVVIEGLSRVSPETVRSKLDIAPGREISIEELKHRIGTVYGMGDFEEVVLDAKRRDDVYDLTVRAKEKSWGPNYLRWGLSLAGTGRGDNSYNILGDYTMRWINRLGAEWKNEVMLGSRQRLLSEFYQPLEHSRTLFVAPRAVWDQWLIDLFQGDDIIAQYRVQKTVAAVDFGIQPLSYGEIRLGFEAGSGRQSLYRGTQEIPRRDIDFRAFRGRIFVDQLDNVNFPHRGYSARIDYYDSVPGLGADDRYQKIEARFLKAFTYKSYTLLAGAKYGSYISSTIPFYDEFTLGGFLNLSGYQPDQLLGQQAALGRLIAYWKASRSIIGSFYTGMSLEAGNVWQRGQRAALNDLVIAGSVFVGYDTILGPLYLGIGNAEHGINSFYFYLGRVF